MNPSSPPPAYTETPPLPPRSVFPSAPASYQPPSTSPYSSGPYAPRGSLSGPWLGPDPRSSSTQSILPETSLNPQPTPTGDYLGRRKLLVIYIHGFLGNDQSFRSFPAHVHALLANLLADSHVIHSKIYPRYKTYRSVDVARDNFSEWLAPHESPHTDVVLVGHSMGGILAADIILMPNPNRSLHSTYPFKHRIIGHISLDCPFLGLHPGIIVSGISSLFKPAPTPQDDTQGNVNDTAPYGSEASTVANPSASSLYLTNSQSSVSESPINSPPIVTPSTSQLPHDPFFNQPFFNDSALQERPFMRRMLHFASKYRSEGLVQAAARHIFSYLEFGSCLADMTGLESRYTRIRYLEDVDELQSQDIKQESTRILARVRFVNYYTLCTGRPKSPKFSPKSGTPQTGVDGIGEHTPSPKTSLDLSDGLAPTSSLVSDSSYLKVDAIEGRGHSRDSVPSITLEHRDTIGNATNHQTLLDTDTKNHLDHKSDIETNGGSANDHDSITSDINRLSMYSIDPTPVDESTTLPDSESTDAPHPKEDSDLLPLPDPPTAPEIPDPNLYTDKDERKQAEREAKRLRRAHEHALKDHAKAVREREKLLVKRERRTQKEAERALKEAARQEKEALKESQRKEKEAQKEQQRIEKEAAVREKKPQEEQNQEHGEVYQPTTEAEENSQRAVENEVVTEAGDVESNKPRRLRKFCNLPSSGGRVTDPTWVDIYMADVDEVGAHCGLFFPGAHYEKLVGDVGSRITGWVQEDLTKRAIQDMGM
ncbi:hypothetical protein F66182_6811 [Fusarium sp. NRRL 66182]|nr:hypothetical protein F66182_6811 [Fusarium sp. NRRL 66182]